MKHLQKTNELKASNLVFNLNTLEGFSYKWYKIAMPLSQNEILVNNYNYSPTTVKHFYKLIKELKSRGFNIKTIEAPMGLQDLTEAWDHYIRKIENLTAEINKKGSRKSTNEIRKDQIMKYKAKIQFIKDLIGDL